MCIAGVVYYFNCNTFELMNKDRIFNLLLVIIIASISSLTTNWIIKKFIPSNDSYVKSLEQERIQLYLKLDSLETENNILDSIYCEIKKAEIAKEVEYTNLKTQYNILKHENKNKSTPIKQFNVAQLDSFWNQNFWAGQN